MIMIRKLFSILLFLAIIPIGLLVIITSPFTLGILFIIICITLTKKIKTKRIKQKSTICIKEKKTKKDILGNTKGKGTIIKKTAIRAIIITTINTFTIIATETKTDIEEDTLFNFWLYTTIISITLASWILPTINRQIYKSVWEDELYTRDLDK